ncbi:cysteine desulfurase [Agrobacterium tumefaciens]|uniref:cysteine desulfurase family protein n=1 Tax=Agrobacterium tumefaciens TaxID=358 RepID=UPI0015738599|nr:cysteine desulfurase [Agrobacterium tumefaciens]NSZ68167.1 cysteine desulfurase [Agrobacterium tumefaciens]
MIKYFDANATTEQLPAVRQAVEEATSLGPLNASSAHSRGKVARGILSKARDAICDALGADDPDNVIFVSSGTEANNIVINGMAKFDDIRMICSSIEHASVLEPSMNMEHAVVRVDANGVTDLVELERLLADAVKGDRSALVCIQAANSETGVIQPLDQIVKICSSAGGEVYLHVDAAQAFGRFRIQLDGIDSIAVSGHKLHAPIGTGFLWLSDRMAEKLPRTVLGGGQERGFRSGTQNAPAIAGLAQAVRLRFNNFEACVLQLREIRDAFERALLDSIPDVTVVCSLSPRLPNTSSVCFPNIDAQALLARLDVEDIICSNGSACSSMKPSASPVLMALGMTEKEAFNCLRFSFSVLNTQDEVREAVFKIAQCVTEMKAYA